MLPVELAALLVTPTSNGTVTRLSAVAVLATLAASHARWWSFGCTARDGAACRDDASPQSAAPLEHCDGSDEAVECDGGGRATQGKPADCDGAVTSPPCSRGSCSDCNESVTLHRRRLLVDECADLAVDADVVDSVSDVSSDSTAIADVPAVDAAASATP
jgi:hypothetical protein